MKCLVLLTTLCGLAPGLQRTDPIVSTKVGLIKGLWDERGFTKFLGVPYGQVNKVFEAAVPHPGYEDIFEADDDTKICAQVEGVAMGTTDCLNLNIYVPDTASTENLLPVLVWIHGGAFVFGSAQQARDPQPLLENDIIVVAINYRLGVFGFMCLDIPEVPGNIGLKDQVLALKWINENIEAFGGDPNQITLSGTSAGGMSTNLHLLSHYENLFHKAIMQSGTTNSYWTMVESDNTIPFRLAEAFNFHTSDIYEALDFLSETDPHTLVITAHNLLITNENGVNQPLTKPCVEKMFDGVENFMVEHPMYMVSDKVRTTPVIIGHANTEFAFQLANIGAEFFETYDFSQHFTLGFNMSNDLTEAMELVKHFYLADSDINEDDRWDLIDFGSDFIFNHPARRMAEKLLEDGAETVYRYVFSFQGNLNQNYVGATHSEEAQYLFGSNINENSSPEYLLTVDRFSALWSNFIKYGDPTPETSDLLPVKWIQMTKTTEPYIDIGSELNILSRPFNDRLAFWDLFYKRYGHYQKWYNSND